MASQINVCTPFSHSEKTKAAAQVLLLFAFVQLAPVSVLCVHARRGAGTVARTNHYLVVVGAGKVGSLKCQAVFNRSPDAAARRSSVQLKTAERGLSGSV